MEAVYCGQNDVTHLCTTQVIHGHFHSRIKSEIIAAVLVSHPPLGAYNRSVCRLLPLISQIVQKQTKSDNCPESVHIYKEIKNCTGMVIAIT